MERHPLLTPASPKQAVWPCPVSGQGTALSAATWQQVCSYLVDFLGRGVCLEAVPLETTAATARLWFWLGNSYSRLRFSEAAPGFGLSFSAVLS